MKSNQQSQCIQLGIVDVRIEFFFKEWYAEFDKFGRSCHGFTQTSLQVFTGHTKLVVSGLNTRIATLKYCR